MVEAIGGEDDPAGVNVDEYSPEKMRLLYNDEVEVRDHLRNIWLLGRGVLYTQAGGAGTAAATGLLVILVLIVSTSSGVTFQLEETTTLVEWGAVA